MNMMIMNTGTDTTATATATRNSAGTMEDGLMKEHDETARPTAVASFLGLFATARHHSRTATVRHGVCLAVLTVLVVGGTTVLARSVTGHYRAARHAVVQCGERVGQVAVNHDYGDSFPSQYTMRFVSCAHRHSSIGSSSSNSNRVAQILLIDDLWGQSVGHSEGSTTRSSIDGNNGLVGYGLWTYPDGSVAYHYTYTLGDGNAYDGGRSSSSSSSNNEDTTIHMTMSNGGDALDISQDTVLLVSTQYNNNEDNNNEDNNNNGNNNNNVQLQQVAVDLSQASQSSTALQSLVDENDTIFAFISQSMANYHTTIITQQQEEEEDGN